MKTVNGKVVGDNCNPAALKVMEQVMEMVRAGDIQSVAIVGTSGPGSLLTVMGGPHSVELAAGTILLQGRLAAVMTQPVTSPIMRAPALPKLVS